MLEPRVAKLESDVADIRATLRTMQGQLHGIELSLAEIKGKLSQSPSWVQLIGMTLATWAAGAAIVATLLRAVAP